MGNDHSKKTHHQSGDSTRVDLGDDLIASTVIVPSRKENRAEHASSGQTFAEQTSAEQTSEEQFENAKILANEGFVDDAKKLLRKILINDPKHVAAREHLQEILDREMSELLADRDPSVKRPKLFERKGKNARTPQATSEEVLHDLEHEFGLLDSSEKSEDAGSLQADLSGASESDRIDLGIAFIEMGLYDQAISHLRAALEMIENKSEPAPLQRISATALLARAYLLGRHPYDAIHHLHAIARDAEIAPADKIEFFYLMGLAYEQAGDRKASLPWFAKVRDLDPHYRDIQERLRKPIT